MWQIVRNGLTPDSLSTAPLSRRTLLNVGTLALGGLNIAELLRTRADARESSSAANPRPLKTSGQSAGNRPTAVIQIFMGGGPSHIDSWDMKPEAPVEIRGEFTSISTNVPGIRVCEHLPHQAQVMDKLAIVRSVAHSNSSHLPASQWMLTGYNVRNVTSDNAHPSSGSIAARLRGPNAPGLPAYVAVPRKTSYGNAAYLGPACNPFTTESDPLSADFAVRNLKTPGPISSTRLGSRRSLLTGLDTIRRDIDTKSELSGIDHFYREAMEMITSDRAARAFNIHEEDPALCARYGRTSVGQGCLLARRLVEAGVTFVTVLSGAVWDTHVNNFSTLKNNSLPKVDRAIAALVSDLQERGLDGHVMVMAMGEFGRTPQINKNAGRDHWPGAMSILFGGGGLRTGQTIGSTDRLGAHPASRLLRPGDVLATLYHFLGIDRRRVFHDHSGRAFPVLDEGTPIAELL